MIAPRILVLVVALILTAPFDVFAQQEPTVVPGDRVRVTAPTELSGRVVGTVVEIGADTCMLEVEAAADTLALPLASVISLEVSQGKKSHVLQGAGVGALSGFVFGFALGVVACEGFTANCLEDASGAEVALFTGVTGGLGGLLLGAAVGAVVRTDRWESVPLNRLRVSIVPHRRGGFSVGVRLRV